MLAIKSQQKIVHRTLRNKFGEQVRAIFLVVETDGELKVQLLSVSPLASSEKALSSQLSAVSSHLCLPGLSLKSPAITSYTKHLYPEVSPFFNIFQFLISQPTRAPSVN